MSFSIGELVGYVDLDTAGAEGAVGRLGGILDSVPFGKLAVGAAGAAAGVVGALFGIGSEFDDVADTIQVGTGKSGKALDGLVDTAKQVGSEIPASFDEISPVLAEVSSRMGLTGDDLKDLTEQFVEAGRITGQALDVQAITGSFNTFGLSGKQAEAAMDALFRTSQQTGVGMNSLAATVAANAANLKQFGFTYQQSAQMVGLLDKAGIDSNRTLATLSRAMVTFAKDGKDPQEALRGTLTELDNLVKSGKDAAAINLAGEVFGTRGASQFVAAVKSGKLNVDALTGTVKQHGKGIVETAKDTSDFGEAWQLVKNNVLLALEPAATKVFTAISGGMAQFAKTGVPAVEAFAASVAAGEGPLGGLADSVRELVPLVTNGLASGLGAVQAVLPALLGTFASLAGVLATVLGFLGDHTTTAATLAAGIVALTVVTKAHDAAMAVSAAGGMAKWLMQTNLIATATKVWTAVQWAMNAAMAANPITLTVIAIAALVAAIVLAWQKSETFRTVVLGAWDAIKSATEATFNFVRDHIKTIMTVLLVILTGGVGALVLLIVKNWDKIKSATSEAWGWVKDKVSALFSAVRTAVAAVAEAITTVIRTEWNAVKAVTTAVWTGIKAVVSTYINGVLAVIGLLSAIPGKVGGFFGRAKDAAVDKMVALVNWLHGLQGRILGAIGDLSHVLWNAGKAVIQGLLDGIESMVKPLTDKLHKITDMIPLHKGPPAKDRKLLRKSGRLIIDGLIDGIKDGEKSLTKVLDKITDDLPKRARKRVMAAVSDTYKAGLANAAQLDRVAKALDKARDALQDAQDKYNDLLDSVSGSAKDFAGIGSVELPDDRPLTASAVAGQMGSHLNDLIRFRSDMQTLLKMGLDDASYEDLLNKGVDGGGAIAHALVVGGKDAVAQIALLSKAIQTQSEALGKDGADHLYKAGVEAARGLVKGLESQEQQLRAEARRIAQLLEEEIQRALSGIKLGGGKGGTTSSSRGLARSAAPRGYTADSAPAPAAGDGIDYDRLAEAVAARSGDNGELLDALGNVEKAVNSIPSKVRLRNRQGGD